MGWVAVAAVLSVDLASGSSWELTPLSSAVACPCSPPLSPPSRVAWAPDSLTVVRTPLFWAFPL